METDTIMKTSCENCVFAVWDEPLHSRNSEQIGCTLGRLEKFKAGGATIEERFDSNAKRFSVIHRFCSTCRNHEWGEKNSNWVETVKKQVEIQLDLIIVEQSTDDYAEVMTRLKTTVHSILNQNIKPRSVMFVIDNKNISVANMFSYLDTCFPIKFYITQMFRESPTFLECVDETFIKCKHTYYSVFENGFNIPADFISNINNLVNEELKSISLIRPIGLNGLTVQSILHRNLNGNVVKPLEDKIIELAQQQNREDMVL